MLYVCLCQQQGIAEHLCPKVDQRNQIRKGWEMCSRTYAMPDPVTSFFMVGRSDSWSTVRSAFRAEPLLCFACKRHATRDRCSVAMPSRSIQFGGIDELISMFDLAHRSRSVTSDPSLESVRLLIDFKSAPLSKRRVEQMIKHRF